MFRPAKQTEIVNGLLECSVCHRTKQVGDIGDKMRNGWPKCHGYTMTWVTPDQLTEGGEE